MLYEVITPEEIADRISAEMHRNFKVDDVAGYNRFQIRGVRGATMYPMVSLGHTNPERWRRMAETLHSLGEIQAMPDIKALVHDPESERAARKEKTRRTFLFLRITSYNVCYTKLLRSRGRGPAP